MTLTKLPPTIQKAVQAYYEKSLAGEEVVRCQFPAQSKNVVIERILGELESNDCVIARQGLGDVYVYGMCCVSHAARLMNETVIDEGIVTFFYNGGAFALSADQQETGTEIDLHLYAWGLARKRLQLLGQQLGGVIY